MGAYDELELARRELAALKKEIVTLQRKRARIRAELLEARELLAFVRGRMTRDQEQEDERETHRDDDF